MPAVTTTTRPGRSGAGRHTTVASDPVRRDLAAGCRLDGRRHLVGVGPGEQDRAARPARPAAPPRSGALLGRLPRPVDGLAHPLAQRAVVVDPGEAEIGEREAPQPGHGLVGRDDAGADVVEQLAEGGLVHGAHYPARPWTRLRPPAAGCGPELGTSPSGPRAPSPRRPCSPSPTTPPENSCSLSARFAEVLDAVSTGQVDLGLRPHRELDRGHRQRHVDSLVFDVDLLIQREVVLDVHMQSDGPAGTRRWTTITPGRCPFPMPSAQCRRFLADQLPDVEVVPTNSTAEAARLVGEERSPRRPPPSRRGWRPSSTGSRSWPRPSRTTPTTRPGSWPWPRSGCPRRPGTTRPASCASSARTDPGSLHAILERVRRPQHQPDQARVPADQAGTRRLLLSSSTSRATSPTKWWPTACASSTPSSPASSSSARTRLPGSTGPPSGSRPSTAWREADVWIRSLRGQIADS